MWGQATEGEGTVPAFTPTHPERKHPFQFFHQHKHSNSIHPDFAPSWWCSTWVPWLASFPPAVGVFPVSPPRLGINTLLACSRLCLCQPLSHPRIIFPPQTVQDCHSTAHPENTAEQPYNLLGGSKYRDHLRGRGVRQTEFKYQPCSILAEWPWWNYLFSLPLFPPQ